MKRPIASIAGTGRGLQGVACTAADTEFWFPGASTDTDRTDYVHLTSPDDAVDTLNLYDLAGAARGFAAGAGCALPWSSSKIARSLRRRRSTRRRRCGWR